MDLLAKARVPVVLTPHPGEMGRLLKRSAAEIQNNRLAVVQSFTQDYGVTLVLKGARTVIGSPEGRLAINSSGNPGLASGGTGDVLTGMIAGFLAQGLSPFVNVWFRSGLDLGSISQPDVDVFGCLFLPDCTKFSAYYDCKSGESKVVNRVLLLSGLKALQLLSITT